MRSIAFYNNKGGVGKTTSVINIAYQLASDKKVLVVDLDGQANSSRFFAEPKAGLEASLKTDVISPTNALCKTRYPNIDIITATSAINDVLSDYCRLPANLQQRIAEKIISETDKPWYGKHYDYVLADLPPALNKITENIISVCDYVFVPIELSSFAIQGVPTVTNAIADCGAKFGGCFVNKFDRENPADITLMETLKELLGTKALEHYIPFSRVVKNSISYKMTAHEYMEWTFAAECIANLTKEIVEICGGEQE